MSSIDSDIESLLSSDSQKRIAGIGRSKKKQKEVTLGELIEEQNNKLKELSAKREDIRNEMMKQCKVNEVRYESLVDKKKRAKMIEQQIMGMTQEFMLMQKQIKKKELKAKELHSKVEQAKFYNDVRMSRKEMKEKFKKEQKESNKEQVDKGLRLRDLSVRHKKDLIEAIKTQKHQMYLEAKEKAKADEERKRTSVGSSVNHRIIQAKENKIAEVMGNITKRNYTKQKIDDLASQISFRIKKHEKGLYSLRSTVKDLLSSQTDLKKKLEKANKEFEQDYTQALKMNLIPDSSRNKLMKDKTFNYNFSGFQEKANKAQFLFFEEERKAKDQQEEEVNVKKHVELSLKLHESMPGHSKSKHRNAGNEISLKFF